MCFYVYWGGQKPKQVWSVGRIWSTLLLFQQAWSKSTICTQSHDGLCLTQECDPLISQMPILLQILVINGLSISHKANKIFIEQLQTSFFTKGFRNCIINCICFCFDGLLMSSTKLKFIICDAIRQNELEVAQGLFFYVKVYYAFSMPCLAANPMKID